jgi:two-component system chemotaxis sensor kinase CheA
MAETLFGLNSDAIHIISDAMIHFSEAAEGSIPQAMPSKERPAEQIAGVEPAPAPIERTVAEQPPVVAEIPVAEEQVTAPVIQKNATAKVSRKENGTTPAEVVSKSMGSLRVNVNLLDTLMTLAGELVLSRNQLLQGISSSNGKATELAGQRIDMITSELQETIMQTRMQPIASIFTKFTRVVRDLSKQLGKSIDLAIEGKEVELDKTILESINDPLTHLVRNSVDHGIEPTHLREKLGKPKTGTITLKAFHDAGQVNIVISDDGKGLDPERMSQTAVKKGLRTEQQIAEMSDKEKTDLILLPGFSTAEQVTDVSGRGVGMDVVVTNLEKLGGIIEIDSTTGKGTTIQIKLPLTLAIIPSQIISVGKEQYAVPQVNLDELLRIPAAQVKEKIEKVGDADVVRLRGNLLPLLNLSEVLGIKKTYVHPDDDCEHDDRRTAISDRRSFQMNASGKPLDGQERATDAQQNERQGKDRRYHASSAINIAVVSAGSYKYGLVVDELKDSEEIVVKPLGRHLKRCSGYAGATIMGDGKVALILDVSNLGQMAELTTMAETERVSKAAREAQEAKERAKDKASLLVFKNAENEHFAAPLNLVERIERITSSSIEQVGGKKVVQYRGGTLPLYELSQVANVGTLPEREQQEIIVFKVKNRELGLMVTPPVDAVEVSLEIDDSTLKQACINGSMIIEGHTTLLVDIFGLVKELNPDWFEEEKAAAAEMTEDGQKVILFAEDSAFFRNQVKGFMAEEGYKVITAEDGAIAWDLLDKHKDEIDIIVTDLEMPNMDGFELTERIKNHPEFSHYKVIALTSLASDAHVAQGEKVGIDAYEIKLDRENLMKVIRHYLTF